MAMNMTNINNDLAAGKDVRIDFKQMQNFGECALISNLLTALDSVLLILII